MPNRIEKPSLRSDDSLVGGEPTAWPSGSITTQIRHTSIGIGSLGRILLRNLTLAGLPGIACFVSVSPDKYVLAFEKHTAPRKGHLIHYSERVDTECLKPFFGVNLVIVLGQLGEGPDLLEATRIAHKAGADVFAMPVRPFAGRVSPEKVDAELSEIVANCYGFHIAALDENLISVPDETNTTYLSNAHAACGFEVCYVLKRFIETRTPENFGKNRANWEYPSFHRFM